jgi:hypothetical protein
MFLQEESTPVCFACLHRSSYCIAAVLQQTAGKRMAGALASGSRSGRRCTEYTRPPAAGGTQCTTRQVATERRTT